MSMSVEMVDPEPDAPDAWRHLQPVRDIWDSLPREGYDLPRRGVLRAERLRRFLPGMTLLELLDDEDIRWSIYGGEHEYWLGSSLRGRRASELDTDGARGIARLSWGIFRSREPGHVLMRYFSVGEGGLRKLRLTSFTLALPMRDEPHGALLCATRFRPEPSGDVLPDPAGMI